MSPAVAAKHEEKKSKAAVRPPAPSEAALAEESVGALAGMPLFLKSRIYPASADPLEREADLVAEHVTGSSSCACKHEGKRCPKCEAAASRKSGAGALSRKAIAHAPPASQFHSGTVRSATAPLTAGSQLSHSQRDYFEPRFGASFEGVRIHTGRAAERAASQLNARAFTLGSSIVFGRGEYQPETAVGRILLAHELTHIVQQSSAATPPGYLQRSATNQSITPAYAAGLDDAELQAEVSAVQRGLADSGASSIDVAAFQENLTILKAEVQRRNLLPTTGPERDLDSRLASFKQLVLTTARVRLASNRSNLAIWGTVVRGLPLTRSTAKAIQVAQIQETVGHMAVGQWDVDRCLAETNPIRREIYCGQLEGRNRVCTGCHLEQQATALDYQAGPTGRSLWSSTAAELTGIPDPGRSNFAFSSMETPVAPSAQDTFHPAPTSAQMERINELTSTYRTIIKSLGPDGYQVWADSFVNWDSADLEAVREGILSRIDQRQSDYLELMNQISLGKRDYLEFQPILNDLLPLTDPDVRKAVEDEIKAKRNRGIIEGILVGLATIGLLLLTIFPPTTAIGVAGFAALEVGLGTFAAIKGAEMIDQGYAYSLAQGTEDVYSKQQIDSGGGMMFMGFINLVTGPLMAYTGALRGVGAAARIGEAGAFSALKPAEALEAGKTSMFGAGELTAAGPGTLRQGRLLLSYEADGTIVATVEGQPDILMVVKDGEAVMYTRAADGTLTAVQRAPVPPGGASGGGAGIDYPSQWQHVVQRQGNWCGAACGQMAAGRHGVEVTQEELAASEFFEEKVTVGQTTFEGGFQTQGLKDALTEAAPIAGRRWVGGQLPMAAPTPEALQATLGGFLESSQSSVILRVGGSDHWIIVDEITADGRFAIRDPGLPMSTAVTPEELAAMGPTGEAVLSFPIKNP